ncbi:MAG: hypothetical protein IGS48_03655 [Oscillatoriales cyanobacterium C42_A2020_001]|nr:hypothetical protein [Leptolyngbyaceae cyanobacterium C42_A2020_001]
MSQPIPNKTIEKAIKKGAKKVIVESGISPSTRSGNKELSHLVTDLSKQSFETVQAAQQYGESLGQKIVEFSRQANKQYLDSGIIRLLRSQKNLHSFSDLPTPSPQPVTPTQKPSQPVATQPESPETAIAAATLTTSDPSETQEFEATDEELEVVSAKPEAISATLTEVDEEEVEEVENGDGGEEEEDEIEEDGEEEIDEEDEEIDDEEEEEEEDEEIDDEEEEDEEEEIEEEAEEAAAEAVAVADDFELEDEPKATREMNHAGNPVKFEEPEEVNV